MKWIISLILLLSFTLTASAEITLREIRTASNTVLTVVFESEKTPPNNYNLWIKETFDVDAVNTDDMSEWKLNGIQPFVIHKFVTESSATCDRPKVAEYHIFIEVPRLINGTRYNLETPLGDTAFVFNDKEMLCGSIKTNQNGYSSLTNVRYANFAIWMGTGGSKKIEGALPEYEVFEVSTGNRIAGGTLREYGQDESSGDFVYRIDLSAVPEGGPYKITVNGYGCSWPFGVGGDFSRRLGHISFRSLYLQRCGCPLVEPYARNIRQDPCHTVLYQTNAKTGEANLDVVGTEPTFNVYGGYHDAGDADRRIYHLAVPVVLLTTYEAFPEYFTDKQYNIPDKFNEDFTIAGSGNGIPDIIDEAEWGTMIWEYLQEPSGGVHWGTETRGYPEPFGISMDMDKKKYGTIRLDNNATSMAAGLFMHLARILKPYNPERSEELRQRAEKAMTYAGDNVNNPQKLYFAVQKYLLTGDENAHRQIRELVHVTDDYVMSAPENSGHFLNPKYVMAGYFYSYIIEKERPTDPDIVRYMKDVIRKTADRQVELFNSFAYPIGNSFSYYGTSYNGWGCNVSQAQFAYPCLLQWKFTKEQKYMDVACQLMDYIQGLNPLGKCYVTGIGFDSVKNPHDQESFFSIDKGWGPKPGILVYGPGNIPRQLSFTLFPEISSLPRERQWVDFLYSYQLTEFTVTETLVYQAVVYPILARGEKWDETRDPFALSNDQ
ncbi:glycoside hydrolase family 9 protein [Candidatus Latescibacterota bacterium]